MSDWRSFWDSEHSIYVNARHKDVHYREIADQIAAFVPAPAARVLDYGSGDAIHADRVAAGRRRGDAVRRGAERARGDGGALRRQSAHQGDRAGRRSRRCRTGGSTSSSPTRWRNISPRTS